MGNFTAFLVTGHHRIMPLEISSLPGTLPSLQFVVSPHLLPKLSESRFCSIPPSFSCDLNVIGEPNPKILVPSPHDISKEFRPSLLEIFNDSLPDLPPSDHPRDSAPSPPDQPSFVAIPNLPFGRAQEVR
jgi:hypothetical protein